MFLEDACGVQCNARHVPDRVLASPLEDQQETPSVMRVREAALALMRCRS
jgi:hypothetical protein